MKKRLLSILLVCVMLVSLLPTMALAAEYNDTQDHWAEGAIDRWSGYGVVNGKGEATFDPDGPMRRGEAAQMFANLLGLNKEGDISAYPDAQGEWYSEAIAKCVAAGILNGKGAGKMDPNGLITREEFLTMYARAICISNGADATEAKGELSQKGFADTAQVSDWAADAIGTLVDKGYVNGVTATELAPQANINRASVMALLDQSVSTYVGKDSTETTVAAKSEGITLIANPAVTTVTGTADVVVVAAGAEQYNKRTGEIEHNDIRVESAKMPVARVQGENITVTLALSTTAEDATVTETGVDSIIVIESTSEVKNAAVEAEGAKIIVKDGAKAESVTVAETAKNAEVETAKNATVGTVTIAAESATATVAGKVETVKVEETAKNATIDTKSTAKVETVENKAENTAVTGTGSVGTVKSSEDVKVETKNTKVENTSETKDIAVTDSKGTETKVDSGTTGQTTPSTPTGGGGGGHSHTYSDVWSVDATNHWHAATCGHDVVSGKAEHDTTGAEGACSVCGYKTDSVAVIYGTPNQYFTTLTAAVTAAKTGETVVLLKSVTETMTVNSGKKLTLDLGEKTLTGNITLNSGDLTVKNGNVVNTDSAAVIVCGSATDVENYSVFTLASDATIKGYYGIRLYGQTNDANAGYGSVVNVEGRIELGGIFISGNLNKTDGHTPILNIKNGAYVTDNYTDETDDYPGICMNGYAIVNVYDGAEIAGDEAVAVKAGVLNVYGGTLTAHGNKVNPAQANDNGTEATGAAISVTSNYNGNSPMVVNISGGTISSEKNAALYVGHSVKNTTPVCYNKGLTLTVTGGQFKGGESEKAVFIAGKEGGDCETYPAKPITGGTFSSDPSDYVAPGYAATAQGTEPETWTVATFFASGSGTADDPFIISDITQLSTGLSKAFQQGYSTTHYYKLDADIDATQVTSDNKYNFPCVTNYFYNSVFDGNGHTITLDNTALFYDMTGSTVKNLNVKEIEYPITMHLDGSSCFENVDVSGYMSVSGNTGAYAIYAWGSVSNTFTFKDCDADVIMIGTGESTDYNAVFVGYTLNTTPTFVFDNCVNKGSIVCGRAAMFIGNPNAGTVSLTVTDCKNKGTIQSTNVDETGTYVMNYYYAVTSNCYTSFKVNDTDFGPIASDTKGTPNIASDAIVSNTGTVKYGPLDTDLKLTQNDDGTFTINKAAVENVAYYVVSVGLYCRPASNDGSTRFYVSETIEATDKATYTTTLKNLSFVDQAYVTANTGGTSGAIANNPTYTIGETTYYVIPAKNGHTNGKVNASEMVSVTAFNEDDVPLASANLSVEEK